MANETHPLPPYFCYGNQAYYPLHSEFSYPFEPKLEPEVDNKSRRRNAELPERHAGYIEEVETERRHKDYNATLARQYLQMGGVQDIFGRWTFPMEGAVGGRITGIFNLGSIHFAPMHVRWRDGPLDTWRSVPYGGRRSGLIPLHAQFGVIGSGLELKREDVAPASAVTHGNYDILKAKENIEAVDAVFRELVMDQGADRGVRGAETDQEVEYFKPEGIAKTIREQTIGQPAIDQNTQKQEKERLQETLHVSKPPLWTTVLRTVSGDQVPPSSEVVTWAIPPEASNFRKMRAVETESTSKYIADPTSYSYSLHVEDLEDEKNCALWVTNLKKNITAAKMFQVIEEGPVFILHICPPGDQHVTSAAKLVFMTPGAAAAFLDRTITGEVQIDGQEVKAVYNRTGYRENKHPERTRVLIIRGAKKNMNRDRWLKYFGSCVRFELEADCMYDDDHDENMVVMEFRFVRVETQSEMIYRALVREKNFGDIFSFGFGPDPCDKSG